MRTENPFSPALALARARAQLDRARRWVGEQQTSTRWALAIAGLAVLIVAGYFSLASENVSYEFIDNGYRFPPDDMRRITRILAAKGIPTEIEGRQISVPRERLGEAQSTIEKLSAGRHSVKDYREEPIKGSVFEPPIEREERRTRNREMALEAAIQELDSTLSASVELHRTRTRGGLRPSESLRATAYLKAEDDRLIPADTIDRVQNLLVGLEPDLKPDAVTLIDRQGRIYLDSGNPAFVMRSRTRMREEELTAGIAARLDWIEGLQVFVKLNPPAPPPPTAVAPPPRMPLATTSVVANAPLALDQESQPSPNAPAPVGDTRLPGATGTARILIQVPISHYRHEFRQTGATREPSPEDLMPYVAKTEGTIRSAVAHVVPEAELEELKIDKIDATSRAIAAPSHAESRWPVPWWTPVIAVGVLAAMGLVGVRLIAARRPAARSAQWSRRERYDLAETNAVAPGPSERVRELVRQSPDAAAGVLQRWIGQGGNTA